MLHCNNDSYYTGYTIDLVKRYQSHLNGTASKYTRSFKPLGIAFSIQISGAKSLAMKIERNIKKLSRLQKDQLVVSSFLSKISHYTLWKKNLITNIFIEINNSNIFK
jgi:putative endonuclease